MASTNTIPSGRTMPATDSASQLHNLIGDDATATFENDPKFADPNVGGSASSENRLRAEEDEEDDVDETEDLDDEDDEDDDEGDVDEGEDDDEDDVDEEDPGRHN